MAKPVLHFVSTVAVDSPLRAGDRVKVQIESVEDAEMQS